MSRGTYRGVYASLADDLDFQALSPDARLTLLILRICPQAGAAAIFRYYPAVLAAQTGISMDRLDAALAELQRPQPSGGGPWIAIEYPCVWVRNGLKHDPFTRLANPLHRKSVIKAIMALPRLRLVSSFCDYYSLPYPFETHAVPMSVPIYTETEEDRDRRRPRPKKTETETEEEKTARTATPRPPRIQPIRAKSFDSLSKDYPGFMRFWAHYPNRVGKRKAFEEWRKQNLEPKAEEVLAGLARTLPYVTRESGKFIPNPTTWLHQARWQDEPKTLDESGSTPKTAGNVAAARQFVERMESRG